MKKESIIILFLIMFFIILSGVIYALSISVNSPENNKFYSQQQILINFSASDNLGIDSLWFFNGTGNTTIQAAKTTLPQIVNESQTAHLNCSNGYVISNYTSIYAINCNATPCGSCVLGSSSCSVFFNNSVCGDPCQGTLKKGQLNITCSKLNEKIEILQSFPDGNYNFLFYAKNTYGTIKQQAVSFSIDTIFPNISNQAANPACAYNYSNINLNATINDTNLQNVWLSGNWEGIWKNYSATCSGIQERACIYTINSNFLQDGESFSLLYYANDSAGNLKPGNLQPYILTRRTTLSVNPGMPDGLNNWYVSKPIFTLTNPDTNKRYYRWDGTGTHNYSSAFNLTDIPNQPSESAGILKLAWWSNTSCGIEQEQSKTFYIDLVNPQVENLNPANNAVVSCSYKPLISAVISDVYGGNSGINKNSISMKLDGNYISGNITKTDLSLIKVRVSYATISNLNNGSHNIELFGQDNAGNNFSKSWNFFINVTSGFNLQVNLPLSKTYTEKQILFNIITNNIASKLEYNDSASGKFRVLCTNCNSYNKKISFNDGKHNVTIRATDLCGNVQEKNVEFFIDSKKPVITKIEPRKDSVTNGSNFFIKYTEYNLKNITLNYGASATNSITKTCESGRNKNCTFLVDLNNYDGQNIIYRFKLVDIANNTEESKLIMVKVDTTAPKISKFNYSINGRYVTFNMSIDELNFYRINYIDFNDASPRWNTLCYSLKYGSCVVKKSFKTGNHNVMIQVLDKAGNSIQTSASFSII